MISEQMIIDYLYIISEKLDVAVENVTTILTTYANRIAIWNIIKYCIGAVVCVLFILFFLSVINKNKMLRNEDEIIKNGLAWIMLIIAFLALVIMCSLVVKSAFFPEIGVYQSLADLVTT